jgi:hypothetical protein
MAKVFWMQYLGEKTLGRNVADDLMAILCIYGQRHWAARESLVCLLCNRFLPLLILPL